ncbi:MAG TPA: DUF711 family protein [Pseudonocardiaceae bacterium]|nr:DUF711 family protein [Pseudonocardiaceae bacterium]
MATPPVRTVTIGIAEPHPLPPEAVARAAALAAKSAAAFTEAGYEVQTTRLSTRPVFQDLAGWSGPELVDYAVGVQRLCDDLGVFAASLGPAPAADPAFPVDRLDVIPDLIAATTSLNCTVQLGTVDHGVRADAVAPTAAVIRRIADETDGGLGNFRFAALASVGPGGPFFPAGYHDGPDSLTVGLQAAGPVRDALASAPVLTPEVIIGRTRTAMEQVGGPVVALGARLAAEAGVRFGGIDLSLAPMGDDSIGAAIELCEPGVVGAPGTVSVIAALTEALRTADLPTCGYNGVMLPILEDAVLARRWADGVFGFPHLLVCASVCGVGFDAVPLPGDVPAERIAPLLRDVATMAVRLRKPLSARLFPAPGTRAGDRTDFTSPYLLNTVVHDPV